MSAPARIFRWSAIRRVGWFLFGGAALVLGRFVWEQADPDFVAPENPDAITGNGLLLLAGSFVLFAALLFWLSYIYVAIDDNGITTGVPGFGSKSLAWSRISRIREVNGGLKLYGEPGDRTLTITSIVEDFGSIRDEIMRRCPGAFDKLSVSGPAAEPTPLQLPLRVRVGWVYLVGEAIVVRLLMAIVALAFVGLGVIFPFVADLTLSEFGGGMALMAIGLLLGYFAWQPHWHALVVERDRIELRSLGQNRVIRFVDLQDVTLITEETTYHGVPLRADSVIHLVFPEEKGSIVLKHFKFPNGAIHAHQFIKALFDDVRKEVLA